MNLEDFSLKQLSKLRLDVNRKIRELQAEQYLPIHPEFEINCPYCKRDIKQEMLKKAEEIATKYGCTLCKNFKDDYNEATKCWTCDSFHTSFELNCDEES